MNRKRPPAPTFDAAKSIHDLGYEYRMLHLSALLILHTPQSANSNAALESFGIHARILDTFLGGPRGQTKDGDYFAATFGDTQRRHPLTEEEAENLNQRLHHLTTYRYGDHINWDWPHMLYRIANEMAQFIAHVDPDHDAATLTEIHHQIASLLAQVEQRRTRASQRDQD